MTGVAVGSRLKVLIALHKVEEANTLGQELELLGHRVQSCHHVAEGFALIRKWEPDLVVVEESLGREQTDAGLRLAEFCRAAEDRVNAWPGARVLILIPGPDWDRFKRAQRTGAHVIVKGDLKATIRYAQTVSDGVVTDRILGPTLVGAHRCSSDTPRPNCETCEWIGATVSYGSSRTELQHLTPVRIALLNVLLFRRRGQSPIVIEHVCRDSRFIKRILAEHLLLDSAVKMEVTRLRQNFDDALGAIGAPYTGGHFLPRVAHGTNAYSLTGNRCLVHISSGRFDM